MTLLAFHPLQAAYLHHMISTAERLVQRLRPEAHYVIGTVYNDFDIISGQFSRSSPLHRTPYATCAVLYSVPMPIGC